MDRIDEILPTPLPGYQEVLNGALMERKSSLVSNYNKSTLQVRGPLPTRHQGKDPTGRGGGGASRDRMGEDGEKRKQAIKHEN